MPDEAFLKGIEREMFMRRFRDDEIQLVTSTFTRATFRVIQPHDWRPSIGEVIEAWSTRLIVTSWRARREGVDHTVEIDVRRVNMRTPVLSLFRFSEAIL